jgi:antitoxin (DNA-binding transcriptional repressor) of toxin-antitoxin stability system
METISVSQLKTHLSAELKRIEGGIVLTVVDHKRPVATLSPIHEESLFAREASGKYKYEKLAPLVKGDPLRLLDEERKDTW